MMPLTASITPGILIGMATYALMALTSPEELLAKWRADTTSPASPASGDGVDVEPVDDVDLESSNPGTLSNYFPHSRRDVIIKSRAYTAPVAGLEHKAYGLELRRLVQ
jgi:hypothetical protein